MLYVSWNEVGALFSSGSAHTVYGMWARLVNAALGSWLLVSALLWRQGHAQALNSAICGVLALGFALSGLVSERPTRLLNVVIGSWLMLSAVAFPHVRTTSAWNQGIVGYAMVALGFIATRTRGKTTAPVNW